MKRMTIILLAIALIGGTLTLTASASTDGGRHVGYGACSISGCPCPAFQDSYGSDLCNNCGHHYRDHW